MVDIDELQKALDKFPRLQNYHYRISDREELKIAHEHLTQVFDDMVEWERTFSELFSVFVSEKVVVDRKELSSIVRKIKADSKRMGADLAWYIDIRQFIPERELLEGSVAEKVSVCPYCNGQGRIESSEIMSDQASTFMVCQVCKGSGKVSGDSSKEAKP